MTYQTQLNNKQTFGSGIDSKPLFFNNFRTLTCWQICKILYIKKAVKDQLRWGISEWNIHLINKGWNVVFVSLSVTSNSQFDILFVPTHISLRSSWLNMVLQILFSLCNKHSLISCVPDFWHYLSWLTCLGSWAHICEYKGWTCRLICVNNKLAKKVEGRWRWPITLFQCFMNLIFLI